MISAVLAGRPSAAHNVRNLVRVTGGAVSPCRVYGKLQRTTFAQSSRWESTSSKSARSPMCNRGRIGVITGVDAFVISTWQ
eukprot:1475338-Pyramimonas_sp.AAC.1